MMLPILLALEAAGFELALSICRTGMDLCSQPAPTNILPPFLVAIGHLQSIPTATHFGGTKPQVSSNVARTIAYGCFSLGESSKKGLIFQLAMFNDTRPIHPFPNPLP